MLACRSCADCQAYWYDDGMDKATGKWKWSNDIVGKERGVKFPRNKDPKTGKPMTPCEHCPKGSPAEEHKSQLTEANTQTYHFWRQSKAVNFTNLTKRMKQDETLLRNFAVIDELYERKRDLQAMQLQVSAIAGIKL